VDDDFTDLLTRLADAGVEFILVGGLAAVVQGAPVATFDIDVVHRRTPENVDRLLAVLAAVGARSREPGEQHLLPDRDAFLGPGHLLLQTELGALDVLGSIEEALTYDDLCADTARLSIAGREIVILRLERLYALKRVSRREKDRLMAAQIRAVLELASGDS